MKTTGIRSFILYILTAAFVVLPGLLPLEFFTQGGQWAMQPYNQHLVAGGQLTWAGNITDRNGVTLVGSENGQRTYADDAGIREATVHHRGRRQRLYFHRYPAGVPAPAGGL